MAKKSKAKSKTKSKLKSKKSSARPMKKKKSTVKRKTAKRKTVKKSAKKMAGKKRAKAKKKISAQPEGYHAITPYLIVNDANTAIVFYKEAFGAKEVMRMQNPDGKIAHAELKIGDSKFMLADEHPEMQACGPKEYGGSPVGLHVYVKNVDTTVDRAVSLGATLVMAPRDMFYGDRMAHVTDPFGHKWSIATHIEDVSMAQLKKRSAEFLNKKAN